MGFCQHTSEINYSSSSSSDDIYSSFDTVFEHFCKPISTDRTSVKCHKCHHNIYIYICVYIFIFILIWSVIWSVKFFLQFNGSQHWSHCFMCTSWEQFLLALLAGYLYRWYLLMTFGDPVSVNIKTFVIVCTFWQAVLQTDLSPWVINHAS